MITKASRDIIISKLDWQTINNEFESHWMPHTFDPNPNLLKYEVENWIKIVQAILSIFFYLLVRSRGHYSYSASWAGITRRIPSLSSPTVGLNSEFSFSKTSCHTKVKEPSLLYYLLIAGEKTVEFISFPRILTLCEMQTASFRFRIRMITFTAHAPILTNVIDIPNVSIGNFSWLIWSPQSLDIQVNPPSFSLNFEWTSNEIFVKGFRTYS